MKPRREKTLHSANITVLAIAVACLQGETAAAPVDASPSSTFPECQFINAYNTPVHGIKMQIDGTKPSLFGFGSVTKMTSGLAHADVYKFPSTMSTRGTVILSTTGVAPSYLLKFPAETKTSMSLNIPEGVKTCSISFYTDVNVEEVHVYKKGTLPING